MSDVELKKVMSAGAAPSPLRLSTDVKPVESSPGWGSRLEGLMSHFTSELQQFDTRSASLDLLDPTTPSKRPAAPRSQSDTITPLSAPPTTRPTPKQANSLPIDPGTPAVTLQTAAGGQESLVNAGTSSPTTATPSEAPIIPPRSSSLNTPLRPMPASNTTSFQRSTNLKYGPRSPPPRAGGATLNHIQSMSRDANRLRVQHRSTASASEPSLIPVDRDDGRPSEYLWPVRSSQVVSCTLFQCPGSQLRRSKTSRQTISSLRATPCVTRPLPRGKRKPEISTTEAKSWLHVVGQRTKSSCRRTRSLSG